MNKKMCMSNINCDAMYQLAYKKSTFWSDPLKLHKSEQSDQSVLRGVGG